MNSFKELNLKPELVQAAKAMGITTPSKVQVQTIDFLMKNKSDLIVQSQTGTGKTLAFCLPVLERINPTVDGIQALILCPTRELGQQISKQFFKLTKFTENIFTECVFGGAPIDKQIYRLKKPTQILVATPGRLIELLKKNNVNIDSVKTIIIDEADEMLKTGFNDQYDEILKFSKQKSETWLFSATMPLEVKGLVKKYLDRDTPKIHIDKKAKVNVNIDHRYFIVHKDSKKAALKKFLEYNKGKKGIVFCKTKADAQSLYKHISQEVKNIGVLHGDVFQKDRDKLIRSMKNGRIKFLITTDIMARGIDMDDLAFVLHYTLARDVEMYTHRSGRTARGGSMGVSLTFIEKEEHKRILYIGNTLGIKVLKY